MRHDRPAALHRHIQENANTYITSDPANYFLNIDLIANTPVVYVTWYGADAYCRAWAAACRPRPNGNGLRAA
ncbi:MAG: hypothetical protein HND48_20775 [Chloroflexi bacterium]|nr:hypothetical protein [Chloroflexota bacterium]